MSNDGTVDIDAFRAEVREFVRENLPATVREKVRLGIEADRSDNLAWLARLRDRGWLVPNWPQRWGGPGWTPAQRAVFAEELALNHAPEGASISFEMVGPVLIHHGSPAQQQRFLPRILSLEHWWCQGYSEPNAGSDLASLATRAVRDGDHYVVDGTKIWTSGGQYADWIFCLVRTDPQARPQQGISVLLIDMTSPGVTLRPIIGIHGWPYFNQIFLDGVRVPVENRVGEENAGWSIAKSLLEHERLNLSRVSENRRRLGRLRAIAREIHEAGVPLAHRPWFARRFRELEVRLEALAATVLRYRRIVESGQGLGPETGMLKLVGSRLIQDMENLTVDAVGPDSIAYDARAHSELPAAAPDGMDPFAADPRHELAPTASARRFLTRGFTIAGGSSEIQHNLLAKQVLGL